MKIKQLFRKKAPRAVVGFPLCSLFIVLFILPFTSCKEHKHIGTKEVVVTPTDIDAVATDVIEASMEDAVANNGHLADFRIYNAPAVQHLYQQASYRPLWSQKGAFHQPASALQAFLSQAKYYGLFPEDYYTERITTLCNRLMADTSAASERWDAAEWAEVDVLLTSAFVHLVNDLKKGRLATGKDSLLDNDFYQHQLVAWKQTTNADTFARALEPQHASYEELKAALKSFLGDTETLSGKKTTHASVVRYTVQHYLMQEDSIKLTPDPDSAALAKAIRQYQKRNGLTVDGKINDSLLIALNKSNQEKFVRIAITLDKFKQLPAQLPKQYIWVNVPAYQLEVRDSGMVLMTSKVIVGKPQTQTPMLTSAISDMITYPQWNIPHSIVKKEILPGLKQDPAYLMRKGYSLLDNKGNEVDPFKVNWTLFEDDMPYRVIQGSGDDNALGVLKFNFPNKYAVYLHDTNQRHLFSKEKRALSHGCVRVEAWEELAHYILQNDLAVSTKAVPIDSLQTYLILKEKRVIPVRKKLPLFIRYFTCEAQNGNVVFYDDIYGEDRKLKEQFFSDK